MYISFLMTSIGWKPESIKGSLLLSGFSFEVHIAKTSRNKFNGDQGKQPHFFGTNLFHGNSGECSDWLFIILSLGTINLSRADRAKTLSGTNIEKEKKERDRDETEWIPVRSLLLPSLQYFESSAQGEHLKVIGCWMDSPCFPFTYLSVSSPLSLSHRILLLPFFCSRSFPLQANG